MLTETASILHEVRCSPIRELFPFPNQLNRSQTPTLGVMRDFSLLFGIHAYTVQLVRYKNFPIMIIF